MQAVETGNEEETQQALEHAEALEVLEETLDQLAAVVRAETLW